VVYSLLAFLVLLFHTLLVAIVFGGSLLAIFGVLRRIPWLRKAYFFSALFIVASYLLFGACNLTLLEQSLWRKAGSKLAYKGGCISHYLGFLGLKVSDDFVFWTIVVSLFLGLFFSIFYLLFPALSFKSKKR